MRAFRLRGVKWLRLALGLTLAMSTLTQTCPALDKPTGAPLVISSTETEQAVPLAYMDPDGKTARFVSIKLHWNPNPDAGPDDDATDFALDMAPENPTASVFIAQLWNASLASALAWQQPWHGARWKVLLTPNTDGTGIDAALAVGMIATAARRAHPDKTVVIGSLNPDGSLGPVSHLIERMDAAAAAGMTRVIIPSVQRFDTDASGQVFNMVRHASDLNLECIPVDNLVQATETTMNDPLPDATPDSAAPKYSNEVASYIDDFAHREQSETAMSMKFAPKEADLSKYPARTAALWKSVYNNYSAAQQAYRAGQVYVAYRLFSQANASTSGINALVGQNRASFDVKAALAESDDLRNHLRALMNPPTIDQGELESAVLVAEMADWAYDINASLEGAQLVTKQTFSQRSDATEAEKDRAREAIILANEQAKYLLNQADFFNGLLTHIGKNNPIPVDETAAHLLPQLLPAQLAAARIFTDGIRQRANDLRDGLLFDPRLVAYVNVLREEKAAWDSRQRKKELDAEATANAPAVLNATAPKTNTPATSVAFDPGNTYAPVHSVLAPAAATKKLSDVAQCLIWANTDCEIATLDEKYLRLSGVIDPATHEWHVKDRAKLDALLQSAETSARLGIAFAEKAEVDSSVLAMIYEKAAHYRIQDDDASALEALRTYWRCALIGNLCWQLAHTHKAQPVDLSDASNAPDSEKKSDAKTEKSEGKKPNDKSSAKTDEKTKPVATTTDKVDTQEQTKPDDSTTKTPDNPPVAKVATPEEVAPVAAPITTNTVVSVKEPVPVPPTNTVTNPEPPRALPVVEDAVTNAAPIVVPPPMPTPPPAAAPATAAQDTNEMNIPVAPIAKVEDFSGGTAPTTNAPPAPVIGPIPPSTKTDNADGHAAAFP